MTSKKPSLNEFQKQLEALVEESLTPTIKLAAKDFWAHWSEFFKGISNHSIMVKPDMLMLSRNFPQYGKYRFWTRLLWMYFLFGIVLLFFYWQVSVFFFLIGGATHVYGTFKKRVSGRKYIKELREEVINNPQKKGMAKLLIHYVAGTIVLASGRMQAHWPQYPSDVITGTINFLPTKRITGPLRKESWSDFNRVTENSR